MAGWAQGDIGPALFRGRGKIVRDLVALCKLSSRFVTEFAGVSYSNISGGIILGHLFDLSPGSDRGIREKNPELTPLQVRDSAV
jgi:hypothetical protein